MSAADKLSAAFPSGRTGGAPAQAGFYDALQSLLNTEEGLGPLAGKSKVAAGDLETALSDLINGKASESSLTSLKAALPALSAYLSERPGEYLDGWTTSLSGSPESVSGLNGVSGISQALHASLGRAVRITDAALKVCSRAPCALQPGRVYRLEYDYMREVNPADPLNDALTIGVQWLDSDFSALSGDGGRFEFVLPTPVENQRVSSRITGLTFSLDIEGVDHVIPASACYAREVFEAFGEDHETVIGLVRFHDVTETWLIDRETAAIQTPLVVTEASASAVSANSASVLEDNSAFMLSLPVTLDEGATLSVNSETPKAILTRSGVAIQSGQMRAGGRYHVSRTADGYVCLNLDREVEPGDLLRDTALVGVDENGLIVLRMASDGVLQSSKFNMQGRLNVAQNSELSEDVNLPGFVVVDENGLVNLQIAENGVIESAKTKIRGSLSIPDYAGLELSADHDGFLVVDQLTGLVRAWLPYEKINNLVRTDRVLNEDGFTLDAVSGVDNIARLHGKLADCQAGEIDGVSIAFIADSWSHRSGLTRRLTAGLKTVYGDGGPGFTHLTWGGSQSQPAWPQAESSGAAGDDFTPVGNDPVEVTNSGSWTNTPYLAPTLTLGVVESSTAGDSFTVTGTDTELLSDAVLYFVASSGAAARYRWDGGSWQSLNLDTAGGSDTVSMSTDISSGTSWTLEIEVVSGTVKLVGVDFQSASQGVVVHKTAMSGSQAAQWAVQADDADWRSHWSELAPDCVIVFHGTNDQGTGAQSADEFQASLETIVDNLRSAMPDVQIVIAVPPENKRGTGVSMLAYMRRAEMVAHIKKTAMVKMQACFGDDAADYAASWPDDYHPDNEGNQIMHSAFRRLLVN